MAIEEAKKLGAMALFGEKYGKIVRVVSVGDFSKGVLRRYTYFKYRQNRFVQNRIQSSVAAGVRRIEAVTGANVLTLLDDTMGEIAKAASELKLNNPAELVQKVGQISEELKEREREVESLNSKLAALRVESLVASAKELNGIKIVTAKLEWSARAALRVMCDKVLERSQNCVAVIIGVNGAKANIATCAGKDAQAKGAHAGKIARSVASIAGGSGGGRPDSAMAGAKDLSKLDDALASVEKIVADMIK